MRYLPFIALCALPLVLWPSPLTLVLVLLVGLRAAIWLAGEERPDELDPAIWHSDPAVRDQRLGEAMDHWRSGQFGLRN